MTLENLREYKFKEDFYQGHARHSAKTSTQKLQEKLYFQKQLKFRVDDLIDKLVNEDFYNTEKRSEMISLLQLLLQEKDPLKRRRVRRLFKAMSDFLSSYEDTK